MVVVVMDMALLLLELVMASVEVLAMEEALEFLAMVVEVVEGTFMVCPVLGPVGMEYTGVLLSLMAQSQTCLL